MTGHLKGVDLEEPIFVVGLNKSGTSLLYLLLSHHQRLSAIRSLSGVRQAGGALLYLSHYDLMEGQKIPNLIGKLRSSIESFRYASPDIVDRYRLTEANVEPGDREAVVAAYRSAMVDPNLRLCEKSPPNLVRTRYLQALFPDATFIVVTRNPYANVCANAKKRSRWGTVEDQAVHWSAGYNLFLHDQEHLRRCLMVRYEELTKDPHAVLRAICEYCGLATPDELFDGIAIKPDINKTLIDQLSNDELELISKVCEPTMRALNYPVMSRVD